MKTKVYIPFDHACTAEEKIFLLVFLAFSALSMQTHSSEYYIFCLIWNMFNLLANGEGTWTILNLFFSYNVLLQCSTDIQCLNVR